MSNIHVLENVIIRMFFIKFLSRLSLNVYFNDKYEIVIIQLCY